MKRLITIHAIKSNNSSFNPLHRLTIFQNIMGDIFRLFYALQAIAMFFMYAESTAQTNTGCVAGGFGIDAGFYSGVIEYGTGVEPGSPRSNDWFQGQFGIGVVDESEKNAIENLLKTVPNPTYLAPQKYALATLVNNQILIDAIFARDHFGGTGHIDPTSYVQASKNGEDPAIWAPGPANVLGKNDIIDVAGFMFRNGSTINDDLWFIGVFNMAEPGGVSYMDFEFYIQQLNYDQATQKFSSGGPQLGHTAYQFEPDPANPGKHRIKHIGDFIFSVSLLSSGPLVETRLWVSRTDWQNTNPVNFDWAGTFDGAFNGAPFGYAGIKPKPGAPPEFCGIVNMTGQSPIAPPWGTKNTKSNIWGTNYQPFSIAEVAINLTNYGMDHASLLGTDECYFPLNTFIVKTRASASFTAQLKDFAGPYIWASPKFEATVIGENMSCDNLTALVIAYPNHPNVEYKWSTNDGNIVEYFPSEPWKIRVDKPGIYTADIEFEMECFGNQTVSATVGYDPSKPFFNTPVLVNKLNSCDGTNGSITLNVTGAIGPYTYTWTKNGEPYIIETGIDPGIHILNGLTPGLYSVTIKGLYSCDITFADIEILARTPLIITPNIDHTSCFGNTNGAINLSLSGGSSPFTFLWNTGNTTQNLLNRGAGVYTVTITDAEGCSTVETFTINQPSLLTASVNKTEDSDPDPNIGNGTVTLTPSGGTPFAGPPIYYQYSWAGPGGFSGSNKDLDGLKYGNYTVTITDANGCTFVTSVFIYEPEICFDGIDNDGDGLTDCSDPDCTVPAPILFMPTDIPCVNEHVEYTALKPVMPSGVDPDQYSFEWTLPGNVEVVNGNPMQDQSVILYWTNTSGGQVCVMGVINWPGNFKCYSSSTCNIVQVDDVPPKPGSIILNNN